jgi:DNA repair protein RAD50
MSEIADRLLALDALLIADDEALRNLSINRTETERLSAMQRQIEIDEAACASEAANQFANMKKNMAILLPNENNAHGNGSSGSTQTLASRSVAISSCPKSAAELASWHDALGLYLRPLKESQARAQSALNSSRKELYQATALLDAERKRRDEVSDKASRLNLIVSDSLGSCLAELNGLRREERYQQSGDVLRDISIVDPISDIEEAFRSVDEYLSEVVMALDTAKLWRNRLVRKSVVGSGAHQCPCCERSMNAKEKAVFDAKIGDLFKYSDADEEEAKRKQASFKALFGRASGVLKQLQALEETKRDLALVESRVSSQTELLCLLTAEEASKLKEVQQLDDQVAAVQNLSISIAALNTKWMDVSVRADELRNRRQRFEASLAQSAGVAGGGIDRRSFHDVEEDRRTHMLEKDDLQRRRAALVDEETRVFKQLQSLKLLVMEGEKAVFEAESKEKQQEEVEGRLRQLQAREEAIEEERAAMNRSIGANLRQVQAKEEALNNARVRLRAEEGAIQIRVVSLRGDLDALTRSLSAVEALARKITAAGVSSQSIETDLAALSAEITTKEFELKECAPKIAHIKAQLSRQEQVRRTVQDNLGYRQACKDRDSKRAEYEAKRASFFSLDTSSSSCTVDLDTLCERFLVERKRDLQRAEQEMQRVSDGRAQLIGRLTTLREQVAELEAKLEAPQFVNVEERSRRKNIEFETTQLAVADLDAYFNALDKALLNFHTLKIREVNKIIKELWELIYRGEDIECIELVSGVESNAEGGQAAVPIAAANAASGRDKSFNYRVVMRKGDSPMDMRGRCSAGQRVLASLVIRLALAETFCLSTGVLALDEPTTNLDELNKAGLAHALARIISTRAQQLNFQLICITHDEVSRLLL